MSVLNTCHLETPLGQMFAIADEQKLHLLAFVDCRGFEREVERVRKNNKSALVRGATKPLKSIEKELKQFFQGELQEFKTPLAFLGTPFQKSVWEELCRIPYGTKCSYADVALGIGMPTAFRAVANANGANKLAIVVPCHRVINSNGDLGGYGGRVDRKQWLLDLEARAHRNHL